MFRETTANCGFELLAIVKYKGEGERLRDVCVYKRFTITLSSSQRQVKAYSLEKKKKKRGKRKKLEKKNFQSIKNN